jgi:hypothetical protein
MVSSVEIGEEPLAVWLQGDKRNSRGIHPVSPTLRFPLAVDRLQTGLRHSTSTGERRQMPKPAADEFSESVTGLHS